MYRQPEPEKTNFILPTSLSDDLWNVEHLDHSTVARHQLLLILTASDRVVACLWLEIQDFQKSGVKVILLDVPGFLLRRGDTRRNTQQNSTLIKTVYRDSRSQRHDGTIKKHVSSKVLAVNLFTITKRTAQQDGVRKQQQQPLVKTLVQSPTGCR